MDRLGDRYWVCMSVWVGGCGCIYLVACRFELPSSKSASGDGASDRVVFVRPVVKLDEFVLSIATEQKPSNRWWYWRWLLSNGAETGDGTAAAVAVAVAAAAVVVVDDDGDNRICCCCPNVACFLVKSLGRVYFHFFYSNNNDKKTVDLCSITKKNWAQHPALFLHLHSAHTINILNNFFLRK